MSKNVQKLRARPARSLANPGDDHELGLWIDYDLLRKSQQGDDSSITMNNRYLELADLALNNTKSKKKSTTKP